MVRSARMSQCRRYRYDFWRQWGDLIPGTNGYAMFVGLNPSTADETTDDPTIRRCIGFAKAWGFQGLCMTNLFAFRATAPADMMAADDPVGPDNDFVLHDIAKKAGVIVAAWGVHGVFERRDHAVRSMLPQLHYIRLTKSGHPGHPLYLPMSLKPQQWTHL